MKIFIAHEKHGLRYFLYENAEELNSICLKLIRERSELGYYPTPEDVRGKFQRERDELKSKAGEWADFSEEELERLGAKRPALAHELRKTRDELASALARLKRREEGALEGPQLFELLLSSENPEDELTPGRSERLEPLGLATYLITLRRDWEYEGIDIVTPESY